MNLIYHLHVMNVSERLYDNDNDQIMFPSLLPQFGHAFFSSKEGGVPVLLSI